MPENHSANGRLDSWKQIADYLKRDVRTAIRWEKERGLPIHRVPGGKRQAVFAHQHEIDVWMGSRGNNIPEEPTTANIPTISKRQRTFLIAGVFLLIIGLGGWLMLPHKIRGPRVVSIRQLTDDARSKWNLRSDGTTLYFNLTEGSRLLLKSAPADGSSIHPIDTPFSNVRLLDLSKDGKNLLVLSYAGIVIEGPLWTISSQGGQPQRVGEAICNSASWSPDNSQIACSHGTTIFLLDAKGRNSRVLGSYAAPVRLLGWTPDGQKLRFVLENSAHAASQWEINASQNVVGSQARALELGENCCIDWHWSTDGKNFIYTEIDGTGKSHLRIQPEYSPHGYELPINIGTVGTAIPGGSPDSLFLLIGNAYRGELLKFNQKSQGLQTYLPGVSAAFVAFSPDREWITYVRTLDNSLWRSRNDGSEAIQLTKPPMEVEVSSWSPDGEEIAFMACMPGSRWRIYLIKRDGGAMREAAEGTDNQGGPSWSPNKKFLVYGNVDCDRTQSCWIRKVDLASGKTQTIPGSNGFRTARWSPDGKYIAALRFQERELMLLDLSKNQWKALADSVDGDNVNWSSDSRYIYIDGYSIKPAIERVRISDGHRETVLGLDSLRRAPGIIGNWFGLTPENDPLVLHVLTSAEIYELKWANQ
jgi:Tol biopolymer transport system component